MSQSSKYLHHLITAITYHREAIQNSTTKRLCIAHDVATASTLDIFTNTTSFKFMHQKGSDNFRNRLDTLTQLAPSINQIIDTVDSEGIFSNCMNEMKELVIPSIMDFFPFGWTDREDITQLAILFANIYTQMRCRGTSFDIRPVNLPPNISNTQQMGVFATQDLQPLRSIGGLIMIHGRANEADLKELGTGSSNYLQKSPFDERTLIGVGPAMFVNHSCEKNVRYTMHHQKMVAVQVLRTINSGSEVLESYRELIEEGKCVCDASEEKQIAGLH